MTRFSPAGWARRERRGPRSRGKRPLLLVLGEKRGAREGVAFFLLKGGVRRERKKKKTEQEPRALLSSGLCHSLPPSSNRPSAASASFSPHATMNALAQRASLRVGAPVSVSSAASGCERGARRLDGTPGSATLSCSFEFFLFFAHDRSLPSRSPSDNSFTLQLQRRNVSVKAAASERPLWFPGRLAQKPLGDGFVVAFEEKSQEKLRPFFFPFPFLELSSSASSPSPKKKKLVSLSLSLQQEPPPRPTSTAPSRATTASTRSASAPTRRSSNGSRTRS